MKTIKVSEMGRPIRWSTHMGKKISKWVDKYGQVNYVILGYDLCFHTRIDAIRFISGEETKWEILEII